jgi:dTDP-D-glucose 4,6-dehydratase
MLQLAEAVRLVCDSQSPIVYTDAPEDDPRVRRRDLSRTSAQLRWRPQVALHDGLRRTADWLSRSGRLDDLVGDPVDALVGMAHATSGRDRPEPTTT